MAIAFVLKGTKIPRKTYDKDFKSRLTYELYVWHPWHCTIQHLWWTHTNIRKLTPSGTVRLSEETVP